MVPDSLKSYLQSCKDQQITWDSVSEELSKSGWSSEVMETARQWYVGGLPNIPDPLPTPPVSTLPETNLPQSHVFSSTQTKISQDSPSAKPSNTSSKKGIIIGILLAVILLIFSGLSVSAYLVATDKIAVSNATLKRQISSVVFSIPFVPKTPKFVLQKSALAHEKLSKGSFDLSMAVTVKGDSVSQLMGTNNFDIAVKGYSDYSDLKNPKLSLTAFITKDFGFEMKKPDANNLYIKVNKVPSLLFTIALGITDEEKLNELLTSDWIKIDTSTLDTEARQLLGNQNTDTKSQTEVEKELEEALSKIALEDVLPNLVMSNDKDGSDSVYKIQFKPSPEVLDKVFEKIDKEFKKLGPNTSTMPVLGVSTLDQKASDVIKDLVVNIYINQKNYYIHRSDIAFNVVPDKSISDSTSSPLASPSSISFAGVLKFSDFGVDVPIDTPEKSVTPEEFYQKLMTDGESLMGSNLGLFGAINPARQFSQSNNAKRRSDINAILNAVHQYAADNMGTLPSGINSSENPVSTQGANLCSTLVPTYLAALPTDPSVDMGKSVSNCASDYDTGYTIVKSASTNRVTVSAPYAELGEIISVTR